MSDYWDELGRDILDKDRQKEVVELNQAAQVTVRSEAVRRYHFRKKRKRGPNGQAVFLGRLHPKVYFTAREAECALFLLRGYTLRAMAEQMGISARTVEYYVDNIKAKLNERKRADVVRVILASDFLENLRYIANHEQGT